MYRESVFFLVHKESDVAEIQIEIENNASEKVEPCTQQCEKENVSGKSYSNLLPGARLNVTAFALKLKSRIQAIAFNNHDNIYSRLLTWIP